MVHKKVAKHVGKHHKKYLTGLGVLVGLSLFLNFTSKGVLLYHWVNTGFNQLLGWSPWTPIIGILGALVYFGIILKTRVREHWYFWLVGGVWLLFDIILLYGVIQTYGWTGFF